MKKRLIISSVISIFLVSILLIGSTYSIFTSQEIDETANVYKTGNLNVTYKVSSNTIQFTDPTPITIEEADAVIPYRITVTNTGNVAYEFDVILNDTTSSEENTIDYQYIMTKVGYLEPISLSNCTNNIIKENVIVPAGEKVDIDIRLWLDSTLPNTEMGNSFYAKLKIDGLAVYNDNGEINNDILSLCTIDKLVNNYYEHNKYFKVDAYRNYIKTASFVDYVDTSNASVDEEGNKILWELLGTENRNDKVIAWLEEREINEEGITYYDLYIGSNDKIYINSFNGFFGDMSVLETVSFDNLDFKLCKSFSNAFKACKSLRNINVSNFDTSNVTNVSGMFNGCSSLTELDVSNFDTSNVTTMLSMFNGCSSLTELDVSNFDTSNVTNVSGMFNGCSSLTELDVSNWDTSNVTNMEGIFSYCSSLTELDVSNFDTSNVTNMRSMFYACKNLVSLDVSEFETSKVENTSQMFEGCNLLTKLDVSNWDTKNLTTLYSMFKSCNAIEYLDVSAWNTHNFIDIGNMFQYMYNLKELDLSNWDLSNATSVTNMFNYCRNLTTTLIINNVNVTSYAGMFNNAATAEGASITVYYVGDNPSTTDINESTESLVESMIATGTGNIINGGCTGDYCSI